MTDRNKKNYVSNSRCGTQSRDNKISACASLERTDWGKKRVFFFKIQPFT